MPSHIPLAAPSVTAAKTEAPIPVRVVQTKPRQIVNENPGQQATAETSVVESTPAAESVKLSPEATARARLPG